MKNLLKNTTNKDISLSRFNFSGFSSSEVWIGYFESKSEHNLKMSREAITLAYKFFKDDLDTFIMVSALKYYHKYDFENESEYYKRILNRAKKNNLIQETTDEFDSYLYGDIPLPANSLTISFDKKNFLYLTKLVMGCDAVLGEVCFLISPKLNLAIYPHEDIGFGVISLDDSKELGINFLEYCAKSRNFDVYIEH